MSRPPIILQYIIILCSLCDGDSLSDWKDVSEVFVWEFVDFLCVVWCVELTQSLIGLGQNSHFGITKEWPFANGPISRNEYLLLTPAWSV